MLTVVPCRVEAPVIFDPDASGLRLHEAPGDRQSEADAAAPGVVRFPAGNAEEFVEHAVAQLLGDPRTLVDHAQLHMVSIGARRLDGNGAADRAYLLALSTRM